MGKVMPFVAAVLAIFSILFGMRAIPHSTASIVDQASASVLRITGEKNEATMFGDVETMHYSCSGFAIEPNVVMTANHCLGDHMTADGKDAMVLAGDEKDDLGLLYVPTAKKPLHFQHNKLVRFEDIMGIGYGYGFPRLTVTFNRVELLDFSPAPGELVPGTFMINPIIHGMSGGPIIDYKGLVVGICQDTVSEASYGVDFITMYNFLASHGIFV